MTRSPLFLGIDFGTTNSSIAYVYNDPRHKDKKIIPVEAVKIPLDEEGNSTTERMPTLLSMRFDDQRTKGFLIGWEFFWKFGRRKKSPLLRRGRDIFESVKSDLGSFRVYAHAGAVECNTPEKVAEVLFGRLLKLAKDRLPGTNLGTVRVVITVPASLNAESRRQTRDAAIRAGLASECVELIDEPIAALLDLLNDSRSSVILESGSTKNVLVFDYGGGTLDLCLVRCAFDPESDSGLVAENLAISQYRQNGGIDVDREVMARVVWPQIEQQLGKQRREFPAEVRQAVADTFTPTIARRLKEGICKKVAKAIGDSNDWSALKRDLSEIVNTDGVFEDDGLPAKIRGKFKITKADLDAVMAPFLAMPSHDPETWGSEQYRHSVMLPIWETLSKADLTPSDLDILVLHGGGCRNPYVRGQLGNILASSGSLPSNLEIVETPDLDSSVARGAALACYWKHARDKELIKPIVAEDIGIMTLGDQPVCLVPASSPLPFPDVGVHAHPEDFYVPQSGQRKLIVPFYTGRHHGIRLSGTLEVKLPDGTKKGEAVRIKLTVDRNKILQWWYSVSGGEFNLAPALNDPWTVTQLAPTSRRVLEHRKMMYETILRDGTVLEWMHVQEGFLLYLAGQLDEAELVIMDWVAGGTHNGRSANTLSLIYGVMGNDDAELHFAELAAKLDPKNAFCLGNYGFVLANCGQKDEAIARMRGALAIDPTLSYVYERIGDLYRENGDEDAALREYLEAIRVVERKTGANPEQTQVWSEAARLYHKVGEYDKSNEARTRGSDAGLNEIYGGDHRQRIAGPDSGF